MEKVYKIILRNERAARFRQSLVVIAGLNVIYFLYMAVRERSAQSLVLAIMSVLFLALPFLIAHFKKGSGNRMEPEVFALGAYMGLHLVNQQWWFSLALFVIILLYVLAVKTPVLTVSKDMVVLDGFPKRTIPWNDLNNLVMKDGLVTIDFRNNHFIQQPGSLELADEGEFNEFCREKLKGIPHRT